MTTGSSVSCFLCTYLLRRPVLLSGGFLRSGFLGRKKSAKGANNGSFFMGVCGAWLRFRFLREQPLSYCCVTGCFGGPSNPTSALTLFGVAARAGALKRCE